MNDHLAESNALSEPAVIPLSIAVDQAGQRLPDTSRTNRIVVWALIALGALLVVGTPIVTMIVMMDMVRDIRDWDGLSTDSSRIQKGIVDIIEGDGGPSPNGDSEDGRPPVLPGNRTTQPK